MNQEPMKTTENHPFDAELARRFGWPVRTKNGQAVQIFQFDSRSISGFSLLGIIHEEREDKANKWLPDGSYFLNDEDGRDLFLSADYTSALVREAVQRAWKGGEKVMFNAIENRIQGRVGGWIPMWPGSDNEDFHWDKIDYRLTQHLPATPTPPWSLGRTVNGHTLPENEQWMHAPQWRECELPHPWRPLLGTEGHQRGDQFTWGENEWHNCEGECNTPAHLYSDKYRTTRPIPPTPALVPWTFEDSPEVIRVRRKSDGRLARCVTFPDSCLLIFNLTEKEKEYHTFASLLANFTTLKGEPCGKEGK